MIPTTAKKNKKLPTVILLIVLLLALIIAAVLFGYNKATAPQGVPDGYVRVESYNHPEPNQPMCLALMPECGVCTDGVVVSKQCYIPAEKAATWN